MANKSKTKRRRVLFELSGTPNARVFVAGSFNNWSPSSTELKYDEPRGTFRRFVLLTPGRYEYKFVVDGAWCVDPDCEDWVRNSLGSLNSVLDVT